MQDAGDASDEHDEFGPEDFAEDPDDPRPKSTVKRAGRGGQMMGAAMLGLGQFFEPRQKVEIPIEIETPGEPPNIDTQGLDEPFGPGTDRMVAPPMDHLKAKTTTTKASKRRRPVNP